MQAIAAARGFTEIGTATRKGAELGAIFISNGLQITSQVATYHPLSDHNIITATLKFTTKGDWIDYAVTVPLTHNELRMRLQNKINRDLLDTYEFKSGPFKDKAQMGQTTKREYVRLGNRPPTSYIPTEDYDPLGANRAAAILNQKRGTIMKLWKEKKTKKAWVHIHKLTGANSSSPVVKV